MRTRGRSNFLRGPLVTTLTDMADKMATPVEIAQQKLGSGNSPAKPQGGRSIRQVIYPRNSDAAIFWIRSTAAS